MGLRNCGKSTFQATSGRPDARLKRKLSRLTQQAEPLASLYARFTEGFDTRDLLEAKALLETF